jgi:hypothetical protein
MEKFIFIFPLLAMRIESNPMRARTFQTFPCLNLADHIETDLSRLVNEHKKAVDAAAVDLARPMM